MVPDPVTHSAEELCSVKFLVQEKVGPAEILHRLNAQQEEETLSHASVYGQYKKFAEGCKEVLKLCKILGFHGGDYEEWHLLGCYSVWLL
jgi:hypothetical protein